MSLPFYDMRSPRIRCESRARQRLTARGSRTTARGLRLYHHLECTIRTFFPASNTVLHLTDTQLLRFGASIGISRPPLDARDRVQPESHRESADGGRWKSKVSIPYKADQLDLSYGMVFPRRVAARGRPASSRTSRITSGRPVEPRLSGGVQYIITPRRTPRVATLRAWSSRCSRGSTILPGIPERLWRLCESRLIRFQHSRAGAAADRPYPMVGLAKGTFEF